MKNFIILGATLLLVSISAEAVAHKHGKKANKQAIKNKIVNSGQGQEIQNPFHPVSLLLSNEESEGNVTIFKFDLPPNSAGSPPHTHSLEDEYFFVTSGTLSIMSDNKVLKLKEGDFASLNRGIPHMFWNGDDEPVSLIMTTTGEAFEAFMSAVGPDLASARPANSAEAGAVIGALAAEYGIEISMEKMPAEAAQYYKP